MAKSRRGGKKLKETRRRRHRLRGGVAPVDYELYQEMSKQSLAQGTDFLKYHDAQHGGSAPLGQAFETLDPNLRGSAMMNGLDQAISDSALLHDDTLATHYSKQESADQSGGKRRRRHKKRTQKKRAQKKSRRGSQKKRRNQKKSQRGGGMPPLTPDSVNAPGLLLGSKEAYGHAGLNPAYYQGTSTEQWAADQRDRS